MEKLWEKKLFDIVSDDIIPSTMGVVWKGEIPVIPLNVKETSDILSIR